MSCICHASGKRLTSWPSFVMFNCVFVTFPCGILGQVWYLIYRFLNEDYIKCLYLQVSSMLVDSFDCLILDNTNVTMDCKLFLRLSL